MDSEAVIGYGTHTKYLGTFRWRRSFAFSAFVYEAGSTRTFSASVSMMGGQNKFPGSEKGVEPSGSEEPGSDRAAALGSTDAADDDERSADQLRARLREQEVWFRGRKEAFAAAMDGEGLETSLNFLINSVIEHYGRGNARAAFYVADWARRMLDHVAGEIAYDAIEFEIGPKSVACGLAAETGEAVITPDVKADPRCEPWLQMAEKHGYRGCWSFPVRTSKGPTLGTFALYFNEPREPTERDLELTGVITDAATIIISSFKVAEERAESQEALRRSEEKFRTMFNSIDEGFCVIEVLFDEDAEPVDYRFLETNPAFEGHTGLHNAVGHTIREFAPKHEQFWFDIYGEIARTGVARRFEHTADSLGRFYSVYAFRIGEPDEQRVAIVFSDISERRRAEGALQLSEERQNFLLRLTDALRPLSDAALIKSVAVEMLGTMLGVERAFYAEVSSNNWVVAKRFESRIDPMPDGPHAAATYGEWIMETYRSGRRLVLNDSGSDERFTPKQRDAHKAIDAIAAIGVPLAKRGKLVAIMAVHSAKARKWTPLEISLVEETAERTWEAVERASIESELRESNERMRLLIESATDIAIFTTDRNGAVNSWNTGSERLFGYTEAEIIGQHVRLLFTLEDRKDGAAEREMETALAIGRALDERWHQRKDGSKFFASGVLQPLGNEIGAGFVKIARDMTARVVTESVKREKELLQTLVSAQEMERARIARDLHDELGQQITAFRLKLEILRNQSAGDVVDLLDEIKEMAKSIDEGVDFLAWELRPTALDDLGLVPAVSKYLKEWSGYAGVRTSFVPSIGGLRLNTAVETAVYRVVQESLNNIHKHAAARSVSVRLAVRDSNVLLTIDDNGVGYDQEDPAIRQRGMGLTGMNERVKLIGGSLEIESNPGSGTTIYVKIPITPEVTLPTAGLEQVPADRDAAG